MYKKTSKLIIVFITFFLLILANSRFLIEVGLNTYLEYFVCGLLIIEVWYFFFKEYKLKNKKILILFAFILLLFSIGILVQNNLQNSTKIRLALTMFAMASYIIVSGKLLDNIKYIRSASYGMLLGICTTTVLALITGIDLLEKINDNSSFMLFDRGFTGGIEYKNYYAAVVLAIFIGIYIYYNNCENKSKLDFFVLIILCFLELISGSKGGYLLFVLFIFFMIYERFSENISVKIKKTNKKIKTILIIVAISIFVAGIIGVFVYILPNSSTYAYRIRGVSNYINCVKTDLYHLIFGNAEMAYKDSNYIYNIRMYLVQNGFKGYEGSYEMGFINALIKNGLIGLLGYIFSYVYIIKKANLIKQKKYKIYTLAIFCVLLTSSLVESFVCNIHGVFGIYCYLMMSGLSNQEKCLEDKRRINGESK